MSLAVLADHMASKGRGPDSMLIHMSPREVQGLQALAENHGGSLTINPETGLPEAGFLDKLLPTIIGAGISYFSGGTIDPKTAAMIVGGVQTARTGDIGKGIQAGLGAYGGASLTAGMAGAGSTAMANEAGVLAGNEAAAYGAAQLTDAGANIYSQAQLDALKRAAIDEGALQQGMSEITGKTTTGDLLSKGFDVAKTDPMKYLKANAMPLAAAFGPAILAGQSAENNMPKTTTGMIAPHTFDPYSGTYTAGVQYPAKPTYGAEGGLMGMDNGGYSPGQLDFTQQSEPVVRMAEGGVPRYAGANDSLIFDYFKGLDQAKLKSGALDQQIAADMQKYKVSTADIARATGTQDQQGALEQRFVQAINPATMNAPDFLTATQNVGLQNQGLANALQGSGMSTGAQYAATHRLDDAAGIASAPQAAQNFYNSYGYKAGDAPGDEGGLKGLYSNINYAATKLQDQINAGKLSVQQAQDLSLNELNRLGLSVGDVKSATGKTFGSLFTPKTVVTKDTVTGAIGNDVVATKSGFHVDDSGVLVPNISSTQNTSTNVTTPTGIDVADASALPVGVGGAGITNINPNGTITTRPDLSLEMQDVRDDYVRGGGNLGYTSPTFASLKAVEDKYPLRGGSKQSYDYLTGKTDYDPVPYTKTGEIMKPYSSSVLGVPMASAKQMYLFDPTTKTYKINPNYAIPTYDKEGKKSYNLTNADVTTFMDKKPSTDAFYTWATTNNLSPEQIAQASGRSINEISKLFTGAKDLVGEDGKIDQTKLDEKTAADEKTNFDADAYLKANPDVQAELDAGKANFGTKDDPAAAAYEHYLRYGKAGGRKYTKKAKEGGLMAMVRGGMGQQFDLGGYSDGGRLLRGPGDGVSDSIPAMIGNKRPARLADGEFVVPARIVSELGNGSTEAGARKLYAMMDRVQSARRGTVGKGRVAKNSRAEKYLPA